MINMEDLKPILESMGDSVSTENLAAIQAIDKPDDQADKIASLTAELEEQKAAYRNAFFNPPAQPDGDPANGAALPDEEEEKELSFDDLFKTEVK